MRTIVFLFVLGCSFFGHSAVVPEKLYILGDSLTVPTGDKLPYLTFNSTTTFSQTNARIELQVGDQLDLWVVNFDTISHGFEINNLTSAVSIPAGDSVFLSHTFNNPGAYVFHDPTNYPSAASTGLGGMIAVINHPHASFFWNIKEHQRGWTSAISNGIPVDWSTYYPDFFTLNGRTHEDIDSDPDARVVGSVGDTLMIYVTNTGQSIHALHFHGYHFEVVFSSKSPSHVGRIKDTQGVYPGEALVLRLVPDKPGEYPVHDHNLITMTGDNLYPYGMMSNLLITP